METEVTKNSPYPVEVKAGESYYWCSCGKSNSQPMCDGSHIDTNYSPVKYEATEDKLVYFCGCKHTANKPLCDGSHSAL